jgi:hypothetical protein
MQNNKLLTCYFCQEEAETIKFENRVDNNLYVKGNCCEDCYFRYVEGDEL